MKFAWIQTEKASYPLTKLCRWLGVTRSGFYAWQDRPVSPRRQEDHRLKVLVHASFLAGRGYYGSPRVHDDLREWEEHVSRKRVVRLMQEKGSRLKADSDSQVSCLQLRDFGLHPCSVPASAQVWQLSALRDLHLRHREIGRRRRCRA